MDHRISKDMISSGMIPSGEKNQEDLNRTQYGTVPSPNALSDVYKSMYEKKEETLNEHHKKDADGNTIPHEGEEVNEAVPLLAKAALGAIKTIAKKPMVKKIAKDVATGAAMSAGSNLMSGGGGGQQQQQKAATVSASADLFDIVKGQLLDEGYNEREINEIMVNLTEEQLDEFLKALAQAGMRGAESVGKATRGLAAKAAEQGANIGKKGSVTGALNRNPNRQSITPKTQGPIRPTGQKGVRNPEPGDTGFKPSPSQVLADIKMRRKKQSTIDPKTKIVTDKGQVMQDNADLFDIVKGQLLDEGLSEEEIRDIMLTLTPDEIMEELSDVVKRNDAINKAKAMERAKQNQVPDKVKEASKRQYTAGGPKDTGANKYTTQDKKTIIDYNKNK